MAITLRRETYVGFLVVGKQAAILAVVSFTFNSVVVVVAIERRQFPLLAQILLNDDHVIALKGEAVVPADGFLAGVEKRCGGIEVRHARCAQRTGSRIHHIPSARGRGTPPPLGASLDRLPRFGAGLRPIFSRKDLFDRAGACEARREAQHGRLGGGLDRDKSQADEKYRDEAATSASDRRKSEGERGNVYRHCAFHARSMWCHFGPAPPTTTWTTVASVERRVTPLFRLVPSVTQRVQSRAMSGGVNVAVPAVTPKGAPRGGIRVSWVDPAAGKTGSGHAQREGTGRTVDEIVVAAFDQTEPR
jgi:hypothetical protein